MTLSPRVGKNLMWQTISASSSKSAAAGPAGRRLAAPFSVRLARSFSLWGSADRSRLADRAVAASLHDRVSLVALASAAPGGVGGGEVFEGTDERASQGRCLELGDEVTSDAGAGLAAGSR